MALVVFLLPPQSLNALSTTRARCRPPRRRRRRRRRSSSSRPP